MSTMTNLFATLNEERAVFLATCYHCRPAGYGIG